MMSLGVQVHNLERIMYAVPKDPASDCTDLRAEISEMFRTKFPKIKTFRVRVVEKSYAFELPINKGNGKFLEVRYSAKYPALPAQMKAGEHYQHIFGTNQSVQESFILQKKLMGPGWMTINNPTQSHQRLTWCDFELVVDNHKDITVTIDDKNRPAPTLKVMSFALKTHKNAQKVKEIAMISCIVHNGV